MKMQEMIVPLALAFFATVTLQLFWSYWQGPKDQAGEHRSGQRCDVVAKIDPLMQKPLLVEVDFDDAQAHRAEQPLIIETDLARYHFSNNGAIINRLDYKSVWSDAHKEFTTINHPGDQLRETGAFLVALEHKTPYYYDLVSHMQDADKHTVVYEAKNSDVTIRKQFDISKKNYLIDVAVTFIPVGQSAPIAGRVLFPAPSVKGIEKDDTINGIVSDEYASLSILPVKGEVFTSFWLQPDIFGAQDRYFINTLVKDVGNLMQRAYFTSVQNGLIAIVEGKPFDKETVWKLQFYCGPKEESLLTAVDPRLEQTLQYGWFSLITKPLSKLMLHILRALYDIVHNYGFAIILLTLLIKLLLLPFTYKAEGNMKERAAFQKKLQYVQEKYKHDSERLNQERAELIRKHGMPGFSGCLPILIQIPVFLSLSWMLSNTIELYQAPFLWISDLSSRDPYYVIAILCALGMMVQMSQTGGDAKQQFSSVAMALIIAAFVSNLSAGLALYICISTLASVGQAYLLRLVKA